MTLFWGLAAWAKMTSPRWL